MMKRVMILVMLACAPALAQPSGGDTAGSASTVAKKPVTGEEVYKQVCQACHMADAKGGVGAGHIPALAANPKLEEPGYPISMVVQGRGAMPGMTDLLSPAQIAAVVTYVRGHFGNHYRGAVKEADVKAMMGP